MEKLTLDAKKENLKSLIDYLNKILEPYNVTPKTQIQLELVTEEIFVNICSYAYSDNGGKVSISFEIFENPLSLKITFEDKGKPYNPLERTDPDITLEADKRQIGGLGVFIVKQAADECEYKYQNETNIFSVKKALDF